MLPPFPPTPQGINSLQTIHCLQGFLNGIEPNVVSIPLKALIPFKQVNGLQTVDPGGVVSIPLKALIPFKLIIR